MTKLCGIAFHALKGLTFLIAIEITNVHISMCTCIQFCYYSSDVHYHNGSERRFCPDVDYCHVARLLHGGI